MSLSCGLGCLSNKRRIVPAMPAILARAVVKNIGLKSRTATRVAGKEPAKMTIPIKPYIHPLVECFKPDSYVLVLCSRWQQEPRVTASSRKKRPPSKGWSCAVWWSRGELNPRPRALCRQFYMRSRLIFYLTSDFAKRQAGPWRFTWF